MLTADNLARGDNLRTVAHDRQPQARAALELYLSMLTRFPTYEEYLASERARLRAQAFALQANRG